MELPDEDTPPMMPPDEMDPSDEDEDEDEDDPEETGMKNWAIGGSVGGDETTTAGSWGDSWSISTSFVDVAWLSSVVGSVVAVEVDNWMQGRLLLSGEMGDGETTLKMAESLSSVVVVGVVVVVVVVEKW